MAEEKKEGHRTASGKFQKEAARTISDEAFPLQRNAGEFGTHGGEKKVRFEPELESEPTKPQK